MAHAQAGIFSLGESSQAHFELDLRAGERIGTLASILVALQRPHSTVAGVNVVVGFRPTLWSARAPAQSPAAHDFSRAIVGPDGFCMPATQHDVWLWFTGPSYDVIFDQAKLLLGALASIAEPALEVSGWSYRHSRDLTGFEDGTANPSLLEAVPVALVPDGEPGEGASIVLLQQWNHHTRDFDALGDAQQERIIGRTKGTSEELDERIMPIDSHVSRTELRDSAGDDLPIFRRSVPYGNVASHGLMFVGFASEQKRLDRMLEQMAGIGGPRDALTRFSTPLTGSYYVVPSVEALHALSGD